MQRCPLRLQRCKDVCTNIVYTTYLCSIDHSETFTFGGGCGTTHNILALVANSVCPLPQPCCCCCCVGIGYVAWAGVLVNMGTYPGPWSQGLSFPAAQYLESTPCPKYPAKECGLKGQVLNFLSKGTSAATGQLSPGLMPQVCSPDGSKTANGWTKAALQSFLAFLDVHGVRTVTLWFPNALQLYSDSFTCPWFMPEVLAWAERP